MFGDEPSEKEKELKGNALAFAERNQALEDQIEKFQKELEASKEEMVNLELGFSERMGDVKTKLEEAEAANIAYEEKLKKSQDGQNSVGKLLANKDAEQKDLEAKMTLQWGEAQQTIEAKDAELKSKEVHVADLTSQLDDAKASVAKLEQDLKDSATASASDAETLKQEAEKDKDAHSAQLRQDLDKCHATIKTLENEVQSRKNHEKDLKHKLKDSEGHVHKLEDDLKKKAKAASTSLSSQKHDKHAKKEGSLLEKKEKEMAALRAEMSSEMDQLRTESETRIERCELEIDRLQNQNRKLEKSLEEESINLLCF